MQSFKDYKKSYPFLYHWMTRLSVLLLIIPFAIWLLYFIGDIFGGIPTSISAGEFLNFYGSFLAFLGTVALGALALWQNVKANEINNRLYSLEENRACSDVLPFVVLKQAIVNTYNLYDIFYPNKIFISVTKEELDQSKPVLGLSLFFKNTTKKYITASYLHGGIINNDTNEIIEKWHKGTINQFETKLCLEEGEQGEIVLWGSLLFFKSLVNKHVVLSLILTNEFAETYREDLNLFFMDLQLLSDNKYNQTVVVSNYKIGKFYRSEENQLNIIWKDEEGFNEKVIHGK